MKQSVWFLAMVVLASCGLTSAEPPDLRSALTRAQLEDTATPLLLVELEKTGQQATLIPAAHRGTVVTWTTGEGIAVMLDDGILTGTRGLGFDRMTSDIENTRKMVQGTMSGAFFTRHHSVLDEDNRTKFDAFQCRETTRAPETVTLIGRDHRTTRIDEHCVSPRFETTNTYWTGDDGVMWKSRQWISAELGYATIERLVR